MKQYVAPAIQVMATEMTSEILAASDAFTMTSALLIRNLKVAALMRQSK